MYGSAMERKNERHEEVLLLVGALWWEKAVEYVMCIMEVN